MKKIFLSLLTLLLLGSCCVDCYKRSPKIGDLELVDWILVDFQNSPIEDGKISVRFDANEKMLYGQGVCNTFFASYYLDHKSEGGVKFGASGSTMKMCPEVDTATEEALARDIAKVKTLQIEGSRLFMLDESGALVAVFERFSK